MSQSDGRYLWRAREHFGMIRKVAIPSGNRTCTTWKVSVVQRRRSRLRRDFRRRRRFRFTFTLEMVVNSKRRARRTSMISCQWGRGKLRHCTNGCSMIVMKEVAPEPPTRGGRVSDICKRSAFIVIVLTAPRPQYASSLNLTLRLRSEVDLKPF